MDPLELVKLRALMERTSGSPQLRIGLIDGPVVTSHPDLPWRAGRKRYATKNHISLSDPCARKSGMH